MKIRIVIWLIFSTFAAPLIAKPSPRFDDYKVKVYSGRIHPPEWISHISDDEWRDNLGKLVEPPKVNFAGKYFAAVHSCGTGCRYYTLTDLSDGRELNLLSYFTVAEPSPKTSEGYKYITDLVTRADSKLLIAQYHVELTRGEECRERAFVLEGEKITPISNWKRTKGRITR